MALDELRTVLVVEDETLIRMDLTDMIEGMGFLVLEAPNADKAIALLEVRPEIALVVTDVDMPGSMNGMGLASAIADRWPVCRVIVVSGIHRPQAEVLPAGMLFLAKPTSESIIARAFGDLGMAA